MRAYSKKLNLNLKGNGARDSVVGGIELLPLRFRYELAPFWDASECCLIHADLSYLRRGENSDVDEKGGIHESIRANCV